MRLDLHTHCREATACASPTVDIAERIVAAVRSRGLDGIAVTEHYTSSYAYELKALVEHHFDGNVTIIPGQEIDRVFLGINRGVVHVVELFLPGEITFRFIAHPGHPYISDLGAFIDSSIHGIEIANPQHDHEMDQARIRELADRHGLILLTNSDAHSLSDIGTYYNEIGLEELCSRARMPRPPGADPPDVLT